MQLLHESVVKPEEIDSLGHMNVRYYMARMERANRKLMESLGLPTDTFERAFLRRTDTYTRFRHEQFEGATLHTAGGVLNVNEGGMRSYIEVSNPETGDVAATFIVTTALIDRATRERLPFTILEGADTAGTGMEIPAYARPRSVPMDTVDTGVTLEELDALIPEVEGGGMMSGKRETTVEAGEVDDEGWLREDIEVMFLPFSKMVEQGDAPQGPPVFSTGDGQRVGWAVMETRNVLFAQPRLGDELAYFSADLRLEKKSRLSRRWAFNRETGQLLGISDSVGICIDLDARRAIDWPEQLHAMIEQHLQPQLL